MKKSGKETDTLRVQKTAFMKGSGSGGLKGGVTTWDTLLGKWFPDLSLEIPRGLPVGSLPWVFVAALLPVHTQLPKVGGKENPFFFHP